MMEGESILENACVTLNVKDEMLQFDRDDSWNVVYEQLKNKSTILNQNASVDAARDIENRWKNRYRDVSPFDSTRVFLYNARDGDYINASFVSIPDVPSRKYILTQGPMQQTVNHFWLMVWERQCPAIIMLNRFIEKGSLRCHPYFPHNGGSSVLKLSDVGLIVELEEETNTKLFIQRKFNITNSETNETHRVLHMQYTKWPDFGVPNSPSAILNFLWSVRATGALDNPLYPPVVHCSAGIGRSGAFVLIDLALILIEQRNSISGVSIRNLFLELRKCRMGIIQTADQLRFCYSAIIKAADTLLATPVDQRPYVKFEPDKDEADIMLGGSSEDESEDMDDDVEDLDLDEFEAETEEVEDEDIETELFNPLDNVGVRIRNTAFNSGHINQHTITTPWVSNLKSLSASEADSVVKKPIGSFEMNHLQNYSDKDIDSSTKDTSENLIDLIVKKSKNGLPDMAGKPNKRIYSWDRSNNALPTSQMESSVAISDGIETNSLSSVISTSHSITPTFNPDGDNSRASELLRLGVSSPDTAMDGTGSDSLAEEYLAASIDLHERRAARLARQVRMRERIENMRLRMRETDMERKRWLPARMLQYLRRFYAESGYVRSTTGAIISSIFIVAIISFGTIAYVYW
ncbi:unnamed protein product [Trichobilharzia szidati]|nr:unnamed protein product [Trichobilharzia szidati]